MEKELKKESKKDSNKQDYKELSCKKFIDLAFKPIQSDGFNTADRLLNYYNGKYYPAGRAKQDLFAINTISSIVNLLLPNFVFQQPYITAFPINSKYYKPINADGSKFQEVDAVRAGRIREAAINHLCKQINLIGEKQKAVQDAFFYPFGVTKIGMHTEIEIDESKKHEREEGELRVKKDTPYAKRVNPKDFGYHPLFSNPDESPKLVHRSVLDKKKVEQLANKKIDFNKVKPSLPKRLQEKMKDYPAEHFTVYEVHDQENEMVLTYVGEEKILIKKVERDRPYEGSDFNIIKFMGETDEFEGIPFLSQIETECIILNEVMTLMIEHLRKFPAMTFVSGMDEQEIERLKNSRQGSIHSVSDVNNVKFSNPLQMGQEYFGIVGLIQSIIDKVLGIQDFQRLGSSRKTATEVSFIQGDAAIRRAYFLSIVKDFNLNTIKKLAALQAYHMDIPETIRASGELNFETFEFSKDDLKGDYLFNFDVDNMAYLNEAQLQNFINSLTVLAQNEALKPVLEKLDKNKVAKELVKRNHMHIESLMADADEGQIFISPEKENEMAERPNEYMPRPKKGEPHQQHLAIHRKEIEDTVKKLGPDAAQKTKKVQEIMQHMADTMILMEQEAGIPQNQPPVPEAVTPPQETVMVNQQEAVEPETPIGPNVPM